MLLVRQLGKGYLMKKGEQFCRAEKERESSAYRGSIPLSLHQFHTKEDMQEAGKRNEATGT